VGENGQSHDHELGVLEEDKGDEWVSSDVFFVEGKRDLRGKKSRARQPAKVKEGRKS